jgi:hypothetical protein
VAVTAKKRAESAPEFSALRFLREVVAIFTVIVIVAFIGGVDYALGEIARRLIYGGTSN